MSSRYKAARLGALLLAAATALLVAAPPALAATSGEYVGGVEGDRVRIGGWADPVPTSLLRLKLDNGADGLLTYGVELDVDVNDHARMIESEWSDYPDKAEVFATQSDKVLWILRHSYPNIGLAELGRTVGAGLSEREAIAGTQAAIWHFSNAADLDAANPEDIRKLYNHLTGVANTGVGAQPPVSLSLTPGELTDVGAGKSAGRFVISATAGAVRLTVEGPDGVEIVNGAGQGIQPQDKDIFSVEEFWLSPPADGSGTEATVKATALVTVETGRLFVGADNDNNPTQTLIVASSTQTEATVQARASWTAAASWAAAPRLAPGTQRSATSTNGTVGSTSDVSAAPQPRGFLPGTGLSVLSITGIGVLLIGAGIGALLLQRKLRRTGSR